MQKLVDFNIKTNDFILISKKRGLFQSPKIAWYSEKLKCKSFDKMEVIA